MRPVATSFFYNSVLIQIATKMEVFKVKYSCLVDLILIYDRDIDKCVSHIIREHQYLPPARLEEFQRYLKKTFLPRFNAKWNDSSRNKTKFFSKHSLWLENEFSMANVDTLGELISMPMTPSLGRPVKPFEECSIRSQQRKIKRLREEFPEPIIVSASDKIQGLQKSKNPVFSPEKALALILDASLSKYQYCMLRKSAKELGCDIFPSYKNVLEAKKKCYPSSIEVTENYAKVGLQDLLNHTAERIIRAEDRTEINDICSDVTLICKWGCDGSSGHSQYKQVFTDQNLTDVNMFLTSVVPLQLVNKSDHSVIYWQNPRPASTRFCRPIKFEYEKETPQSIRKEVERVEKEISDLETSKLTIRDKNINVHYRLLFTMIDGKVAEAITDTSSMAVCCICKARPSEMNNLELLGTKPESEEALQLGMSPLHARIKFMECILHIAYNTSFKEWRTNKFTKKEKEDKKKEIQEKFRTTLGLHIDIVKQGLGTANDGNTSRRFFQNPNLTAKITGVDSELIHRFGVILDTINSSAAIHPSKFDNYCRETANLFVKLYKWYNMPNTVHKILWHGGKIISSAVLPIGMLSEEAQETRNKEYRNYRLDHSRKNSRTATNEDAFCYFRLLH